MSIPEFSLRLQEGIQGGFLPPRPRAIVTVTGVPSENLLQIASESRPDGAQTLQEDPPKAISASNAHTVALVDELREILRSLPTESPPGSEDIYGMDTSIAFGSADLEWRNGAPGGCARIPSDVQPTEEQKAQFRRAVEIVKELQATNA